MIWKLNLILSLSSRFWIRIYTSFTSFQQSHHTVYTHSRMMSPLCFSVSGISGIKQEVTHLFLPLTPSPNLQPYSVSQRRWGPARCDITHKNKQDRKTVKTVDFKQISHFTARKVTFAYFWVLHVYQRNLWENICETRTRRNHRASDVLESHIRINSLWVRVVSLCVCVCNFNNYTHFYLFMWNSP